MPPSQLPKVNPFNPVTSISSKMASNPALSKMLEIYRISPQTGFALDKPSPKQFKNEALRPWTDISSRIPSLIKGGTFRSTVLSLPVLHSNLLGGIEELRLAFVILSFLASAYIWGNIEVDSPSQILPKSIAVPLLEVAQKLEIQPAYCYMPGSIWLVTQDEDGTEKCVCSFTGTKSEEHFNLTTNRVERKGGEALSQALLASRFAGQRLIKEATESLDNVATILDECKNILASMRNGCDPDDFYFKLRPYLNGSQNVEGGVRYEADGPEVTNYKLPGATAAQSSLFQALDTILGISHAESPSRRQFMLSMRKAMPGYHVRFLEDIESLPSIQAFVNNNASSELRNAYNKAVQALTAFRSEHIQIVTLYVLSPSKKHKSSEEGDSAKPMQGSGGSSDLFALLKGLRDDTKKSTLVIN